MTGSIRWFYVALLGLFGLIEIQIITLRSEMGAHSKPSAPANFTSPGCPSGWSCIFNQNKPPIATKSQYMRWNGQKWEEF